MRDCAAFLSVVVLGLAAAAPQPARAGLRTEIHSSGALTVTWHGDPARGCAEAGVCDIAGAVTLDSDPGDSVSESSGGNSLLDTLNLGVEDATVRVVRGPPEQPAGVCLDHGGPLELSLGTGPTSRGRVQVLLVAFDSPLGGPLPASRCAGPLPSDLAPALPIATVRRSDLRRRDVKLDFSGRRPFAAGAFSGEIASTFVIRARVTHTSTRARRGSLPVGVPPPTRLRRVADLRLRYRATPRPEPLSLAFRAGGPPRCESLDACALAGTVALTMTKPVDLEIGATVPLARGRKATLAAALAGLRAGRASLFVAPRGEPAGQAVYELTRDGAAWCHDARALELPELVAEARGKRLALGLGGPQLAEAEDPLRSRCPGPASSPERDGALASGTIDLARLGERQLGVRLGGRAVRDPDFTVTPSGGLVLDLERTRQTVRAQSIRVPR